MLIALSGGQKAGILAVAAAFIAFALIASFLLPRRNPDFPGRRGLPFFVLVTLLLFASMLTAMAVLAVEEEEAEPRAAGTQPSETTGTETGAEQPSPQGDPQAGAQVFESAGCGGCHMLEAAGSTGTVGPNLDESQPSFELAVDRVTNGSGVMPAFGDQLSEEQIRNVAAYVVESTK